MNTSALTSLFLASLASAQTVSLVLDPPAAPSAEFEYFGSDVCRLGDVDGDGTPDFAVHARRPASSDPAVRVYSGEDRSILLSLDLGSVPALGTVRLSGAGDLDADGVPELLVGVPLEGSSSGFGQRPGQVLVFSLGTGEILRVHDGTGDMQLGAAVAGGGDWNADGVADYLVGAPGGGVAGTGAVYVYSGADGSVLDLQLNPLLAGELGRAVAVLGDVAGSGPSEVLCGGDGMALVFTPVDGTLVRTHTNTDDGFGDSVLGLGDVTGDGTPDYAIGAFSADAVLGPDVELGRLRVYSGANGTVLWTATGPHPGSELGEDLALLHEAGAAYLVATTDDTLRVYQASTGLLVDEPDPYAGAEPPLFPAAAIRVDTLGDLDGDGSEELVVGVPSATLVEDFDGMVRIDAGIPLSAFGLLGARSGQASGAAVAWIGDVNGDGYGDCAVGAPHEDAAGYDAGAVRVLSGRDGSELWSRHGVTGSQLGASLAALDDLDGDGVRDLAVGEPWVFTGSLFGSGLRRSGAVKVLSGADGSQLHEAEGETAGERFGATVAAVGDVNQDGATDYAVGAPGLRLPFLLFGTVWTGRVSIRSGADGAQLTHWIGSSDGRVGTAVAGPGDADGDGAPDLAYVATNSFDGTAELRVTRVFGWTPIWTVDEPSSTGRDACLATLGDVDLDGVVDIALGMPNASPGSEPTGLARVRSGADGSLIVEHIGTLAHERFGAAVAGSGDIDLDGVPDVAIGSPGALSLAGPFVPEAGRVEVFSRTGSDAAIRTWEGTSLGARLGASLAGGGDQDGDGLDDLLAGAPGTSADLGTTWTLDTRAIGTSAFGTGTPNCIGPHLAVASEPIALGTVPQIRGDNGQASSLSGFVVSLLADPLGTDLGLGCLVHVSLPATVIQKAVLSDADGYVAVNLPVPSNPAFVGLGVHAQLSFSNTSDPCALLSTYQLSTSQGLTMVVQP